MNKTRGWPRVTSLKHVSIIYMIELTAQLQSNIFWAAEYFYNKEQQSYNSIILIIIIPITTTPSPSTELDINAG